VVDLVGIKETRTNDEGKVIGYVLKTGEELEQELEERLKGGERLVKVVYQPFYAYLDHLKKNKIPHKKAKLNRWEEVVVVEIAPNFKPFDGIIGICEIYYKLEDDEKLEDVIEYIKGGE